MPFALLEPPVCVHVYSGAPASASFLVAPKWCTYCGVLLWGRTHDLWECSRCGGLCHKRCVPAGDRLDVLCPPRSRYTAHGGVLHMPAPPAAAAADPAPTSAYAEAESSAGDCIDFAFPGGPAGSQPARAEPVRVSTAQVMSMVRDMVQDRSLASVEWSLSDLAAVAEVHHRSYLRRLAEGTTVRDTPLVERLLTGIRHSLACYGTGHRPEVDARAFDEASYHAAAVATLADPALGGGPATELLRWCWLPGHYCPAWHLAVDKLQHQVVLAVRGTLHAPDLLIDVNGGAAGFCGGLAHAGIAAAAAELHREVSPAIRELTDERSPYHRWPLIVTGHSLGGSVAALLCLLLRKEGVAGPLRAQALCFGPVPCVSEDLAHAADGMCVSVVLGKDIGARLSLASVDGLLADVAMPKGLWGRLEVAAAVAGAVAVAASSGWPSMERCRTRPAGGAALCPPGETLLLHLCKGDDEEADVVGHRLPQGTPLLRRAPPAACSRVLLGSGMIADHRPETYAEAITSLSSMQSRVGLHALHRAGAGAVGATLGREGVSSSDLAFAAFS
eukprot:TRINITY_DN1228_c6_g1_i1.p1 TRINITY_DN1228_c6_g1~~TRINITY_DN1228_c6_g1_i1.p1  ORF type:complete len:559 (+),score=143.19 TRINITY_DN1228_c6_g1_i1:82-1758(+)